MDKQNNIQDIIEILKRDDSIDAPMDSIKWAKNLFAVRAMGARPGILQRIKASLNVDLSHGALVRGERSASSSAVRQVLFEAGDFAVDLRITKTSRGFDVKGQILGDGFSEGSVKFIDSSGRELSGSVLDAGFTVVNIKSDDYQIVASNENTEIVIDSIRV